MLLIVYKKGYLGIDNHINDFLAQIIMSPDNPNHILIRNPSEHHMPYSHSAPERSLRLTSNRIFYKTFDTEYIQNKYFSQK